MNAKRITVITIIGNKHASSIVIARFFSKKLITILGFLIKKLIASSSRVFILIYMKPCI